MRIYKKINKRAQIDSTLVWFFAIFIIMFILILFITIAFLMADKKSIFGTSSANTNYISSSNDPGTSQTLFSVLNSKISYNGKTESVMNSILDSFGSYTDAKSPNGSLVDKYGIGNYYDISRTTKSQMVSDGFDSLEIDKINSQNQMLALEVKKKLDLYCSKYRLGVPQGMITEEGKMVSSDSLGNRIYFSMSMNDPFPVDWSPVIKMNISYNGLMTDIEFTELEKCMNQSVIVGQKNG